MKEDGKKILERRPLVKMKSANTNTNNAVGYPHWQGPTFQIVNSDDKVSRIDTSAPQSPFYGPALAKALKSKEKERFRSLGRGLLPRRLDLPGPRGLIYTPLHMAQHLAANKGLSYRLEYLAGYHWGIGIDAFGPQGYYATPLSILPW